MNAEDKAIRELLKQQAPLKPSEGFADKVMVNYQQSQLKDVRIIKYQGILTRNAKIAAAAIIGILAVIGIFGVEAELANPSILNWLGSASKFPSISPYINMLLPIMIAGWILFALDRYIRKKMTG